MPRYLYGDSVPSGLPYDFLATLELFVGSASRILLLEREMREAERAAQETLAVRQRQREQLERFHRNILHTLRDSSSRAVGEEPTLEYARALAEAGTRFVDSFTSGIQGDEAVAQGLAAVENERRIAEVRRLVEGFFERATMLPSEAAFTHDLVEQKNQLTASALFPGAIRVELLLADEALPEWRAPRRIAEIAAGLQLTVGARKSWFKSSSERDRVLLDELYLGGFRLTDESVEIRVRRRPEQRDGLRFTLYRAGEMVTGQVLRDDGEAGTVTQLEPEDCAALEHLSTILRSRAAVALPYRQRALSVRVDDEDVFVPWRVPLLLRRLVDEMVHSTSEIARRSPNDHELSIKIESDAGHREELYLKKEVLLKHLAPLHPEERALFAQLPLGQSEFFKAVSAPPPA